VHNWQGTGGALLKIHLQVGQDLPDGGRHLVEIWSWLGRRRAWEHIRVSSRSTMSRSSDSHEQIEIEVGYTKW
jgi:hypothetical protein